MKKICVETTPKRWISNPEAQKYLGVGPDFMQNLRDSASIPWYKHGKTIWYELRVLDEYVLNGRVI